MLEGAAVCRSVTGGAACLCWQGTFMLTGEPILEPPQRLRASLAAKSVAADAFVSLQHGETRLFDLLRPAL